MPVCPCLCGVCGPLRSPLRLAMPRRLVRGGPPVICCPRERHTYAITSDARWQAHPSPVAPALPGFAPSWPAKATRAIWSTLNPTLASLCYVSVCVMIKSCQTRWNLTLRRLGYSAGIFVMDRLQDIFASAFQTTTRHPTHSRITQSTFPSNDGVNWSCWSCLVLETLSFNIQYEK